MAGFSWFVILPVQPVSAFSDQCSCSLFFPSLCVFNLLASRVGILTAGQMTSVQNLPPPSCPHEGICSHSTHFAPVSPLLRPHKAALQKVMSF